MTTRRKLAIATWRAPAEGNIYGKLTVDVTEVMKYLAATREKTGEKVTITHFVGHAVADALADMPSLNGRIFLGRYIPHETVDITFLVALEEGADLAKATVARADKKGVPVIAQELRALAAKLRDGQDEDFNKAKPLLKALPTWALRPIIFMTGWLASSAGLSIPALGVRPYAFGSAIITSVGMLGVDEAYAPPTPFARVPVYVLIGAVRDLPAVVDGEVVVRKQMTLTTTLDHRFIDGFQGGILARRMRDLFANPWQLDAEAEE